MKPAFSLDFRNDAITLLHRTSGGWHQVGRVPLDEPDLPAALSYLRATALGLSPRGLATKLILPDDQLLVTAVDAPGPEEDMRLAQIRRALEGRTPYDVEDLVFDWEEVDGEVRVAVVARETLAEAEGFASEHRFNPVAFVAAPSQGYRGEPWFGLTAQAASLLAEGETVESDGVQVAVSARPAPAEMAEPSAMAPAATEAEPEALTIPEPAPQAVPEVEEFAAPEFPFTYATAAPAPPDPVPLTVAPVSVLAEPAPEETQPAPEDAAPAPTPRTALRDEVTPPAPPLRAEPRAPKVKAPRYDMTGFVKPAPRVEDRAEAAPSPARAAPQTPRDTPIFGLANDEPPASAAFGAPAALPDDSIGDLPEDLSEAQSDIGTENEDVVTEAPMALDVEDDAPPTGNSARNSSVPDDVPPAPGFSPAMGFASRRASVDGGLSARAPAAPPRPTVPRPTAAKALVAAPAPKAERPPINRPTAVAPVVPKETKGGGLRGLGALVTAPGIPGTRKKKAAEAAPAVAADSAQQASSTARNAATGEPDAGLGRGLSRKPARVRGKPRYLGLILTAVLLLVLAILAAWSTSLAFRSTGDGDTQLASPLPAPEDEMLADGIEPEAAPEAEAQAIEAQADTAEAPPLAVDEATVTPDPAPTEPAPTEPEATELALPTLGADDIQLAARDQAPPAPAPLALPEVAAQGDPLPTAQAPPPPFGTVYQFDANGLIVPTPEGIVTPEGVRLVAGKPPVLPKPRPEGLAPQTPAATPEAAPEATPTPAETTEALDPAATFGADPGLAGFRPKARPEGLAPAIQLNDAAPETAPAIVNDNRLAGKRPLARPETVLLAGEAARAAAAAASASLAAQAEQASAATSPMAIAISRRPAPRPQDLSRAVEAAVAAAIRTPEPQPEPEAPPAPEPEQLASLASLKAVAPKPKPAEPEAEPTAKSPSKSAGRGRDGNIEADEEPEVEASAPVGKQSGSVAKQATFKNALALDKTALIGVYGSPSKRYAMIRTSSGRYKKVKVGDSIDGGRIQAITASEVRYQKGSRLMTLSLPKG